MAKAKRKAAVAVATSAKKAGRPISEALGLYDKSTYIPRRITEGIEKLGKGNYLLEAEFLRLCDIKSSTDFSRFRDKFTDYFATVPGPNRSPARLWFGSKKDAADFKGRMP